ncbi:unnamed protein product [Owenia fusiformis]|uniref:Uncharacterized protein n=1 Tax=Owenia fusiformis TaxID=6347 RepID=A0A8J1XGP8_OWEFU|nr:unnamed protein product [Owenia fusiformis]
MNPSNGRFRPMTEPKGQYVTGKTKIVPVASASNARQIKLPTTDQTSSFKRLNVNKDKRATRLNDRSQESLDVNGASIYGVWTSRKYARRLAQKVAEKRATKAALVSKEKEPTYRLEPDKVFNDEKVKRLMDEILNDRLSDMAYTPNAALMMSRVLTEEIKDAVKKLNYTRYKIIVHTVISQNIGQDVRVASRCVWDANFDTSATSTFANSNVNCSASVYAVYTD